MPKTLAEGKNRVAILLEKPADVKAPTVDELNKGLHASCNILASDYNVGFSASETVDEPALCDSGNTVTFGKDNATIELTIFRYIDPETGKPDPGANPTGEDHGDAVFQALKEKGTRFWVVQREGAEFDVPWAAGDDVEVFEATCDRWQHVDRTGWQKRKITGGYQGAWQNVEVAASGTGGGNEGGGAGE